jgi:hypothetical protein
MYVEVYYADDSARRRYLLQSDAIWSFDDQYSRRLPATSRRLQNGDFIQVLCVYDSMERTTPTIFGPSTTDEMCWHQLDYYPAQQDITCSGPVWRGVMPVGVPVEDIRHMLPQPLQAMPAMPPGALGIRMLGPLCPGEDTNAIDPAGMMGALMGACMGEEGFLNGDCLKLLTSVMGCACKCNPGVELLDDAHKEMVSTVAPILTGMLGRMMPMEPCPDICPDLPAPPIYEASEPAPPFAAPATSAPMTTTEPTAMPLSAPTKTPVVVRPTTPTSMPLGATGVNAAAATNVNVVANKPSSATPQVLMSVACRSPLISMCVALLSMLLWREIL